MLDNMSPSEIVTAISLLKNENLYDNLLLEASGGINETNVLEYAKTGVDIISMGCLTNSVPTIDLSMKIA